MHENPRSSILWPAEAYRAGPYARPLDFSDLGCDPEDRNSGGRDFVQKILRVRIDRHGCPNPIAQRAGMMDDTPVFNDDSTMSVIRTGIALGPGTMIGPYKLLQKIGEGGMGVVFMAEQEKPVRRKVALKVIKPGMDTGQVIARFEAERQALAIMDHPHIARVLDAGATETGRPFFVMELVKGRADHRVLRPQSPHAARNASSSSSRSARRSSTPTRRGSSTATSSPRTSWSRSTTASPCPR